MRLMYGSGHSDLAHLHNCGRSLGINKLMTKLITTVTEKVEGREGRKGGGGIGGGGEGGGYRLLT